MKHWSVPPAWAGETAFIVAGGPSVAGLDLTPLAGRRVIAINSSYAVAPFAQYLIFADVRWWDEHKARPGLQSFAGEIVAIHSTATDHGRHRLKRLKRAKPADDPLPTDRRTVAVRYTTVTAAIGLAVHLGATRIVLIGVDQRRGPEGECHHHPPHKWKNKAGDTSWDRQLPELRLLAAPLRERGIAVINASPTSRVDWWPKRSLDEVLADEDMAAAPAVFGSREATFGVAQQCASVLSAPQSTGALITEPYRALNAALHHSRPDFGRRGDRHVRVVAKLMERWKTEDVLDYGCGKGRLAAALPNVRCYDPSVPAHAADPGPADLTVTTDVLEHVEPECLDAVLAHLRDRTRFKCYAVISLKPDRSKSLPDGSNPHRLVRPFAWWRETLQRYFFIDAARESGNGAEAVFHMRPRWDALTVVTFLWAAQRGIEAYGPEHVNVMARMVARHLKLPHRFVCITDCADGIETETLPLWPEIAQAVPPKRLSCYRRLKLFAADAGDWLGQRILMLDLDGVITGPLDPLVDRPEPFVIWRDPLHGRSTRQRVPYNGGMWLLTAGARRQVWQDFDPATSPAKGSELGFIGSDQRWISYRLGPDETTLGRADGVYSYRYDVKGKALPGNAAMVWFHGQPKPWSSEARAVPWIAEHWR